ncbi:hypothetical protein NAPIS_ORF00556 [Vairimorpha apis BRL 01]|uniref:Uncharacterized protein n=1 Tax=Vairimorpha apis BRL 01 TaxID=1037528 RepID=T0MFL9_9MICR|nr:hypothetical protein NAPIS_ORF00556 [Vairimorpha apis BRL 01]
MVVKINLSTTFVSLKYFLKVYSDRILFSIAFITNKSRKKLYELVEDNSLFKDKIVFIQYVYDQKIRLLCKKRDKIVFIEKRDKIVFIQDVILLNELESNGEKNVLDSERYTYKIISRELLKIVKIVKEQTNLNIDINKPAKEWIVNSVVFVEHRSEFIKFYLLQILKYLRTKFRLADKIKDVNNKTYKKRTNYKKLLDRKQNKNILCTNLLFFKNEKLRKYDLHTNKLELIYNSKIDNILCNDMECTLNLYDAKGEKIICSGLCLILYFLRIDSFCTLVAYFVMVRNQYVTHGFMRSVFGEMRVYADKICALMPSKVQCWYSRVQSVLNQIN